MNGGCDIGAKDGWTVVLGAALLGTAVPVWTAAEGGDGPAPPKRFRLSGTAGYEYVDYTRDLDAGLIHSRNQIELEPELDMSLTRVLQGVGALDLRDDFSDRSRSRLFVEKAYLHATFASVDLRIGRQYIRWGQSDVMRPTDSFMRHDDRDFVQVREEPIDAARVWYEAEGWTVEGVWAPFFQADLFPLDPRNRWSDLPLTTVLPGVGPVDLRYSIDRSARPARGLRSSQAGVRVSRKQGGSDWSFSYADTFDRTPTFIDSSLIGVDPAAGEATVLLTPSYKRIQVLGGDWSTVAAGFGIRAESSYTLTSDWAGADPRVDDPYLRLVTGVDRAIPGFSPGHTFYFNVLYQADTEVPRHGEENHRDVQVRFRHFYQQGLTWTLEYRIETEVTISLKGFVNLEQHDYMLRPEVAWHPNDTWTLAIGADLLEGGAETFFGGFERNNSLRGRLTVHF